MCRDRARGPIPRPNEGAVDNALVGAERETQQGAFGFLPWTPPERSASTRVVGPPRYLAHNSPFVPGFLKFGEVQLPVANFE